MKIILATKKRQVDIGSTQQNKYIYNSCVWHINRVENVVEHIFIFFQIIMVKEGATETSEKNHNKIFFPSFLPPLVPYYEYTHTHNFLLLLQSHFQCTCFFFFSKSSLSYIHEIFLLGNVKNHNVTLFVIMYNIHG